MNGRTTTRVLTLDERYGRTRSRRRRGRLIAIVSGAVLVVGVVAWSLWTGIGGVTTALDVQTTDIAIHSAEETEVQWLVTGRPGTKLVCSIEAEDEQGVVVGLAEIVVSPTNSMNRTGDTVVRTVRRASNGLIRSCRDA